MKWFSTAKLPALFTWLSIAVFLVFCGKNWMFNHVDWCDQWMYSGLGLYFDTPYESGSPYKVSRLPWILFLYVITHVFTDPVYASIAIGFILIPATGLCAFYALRRFVNPIWAGTLSLLIAIDPMLHGGGGWYYSQTFICFLYVLALAVFLESFHRTLRASSHAASVGWPIGEGICVALLLHTDIRTIYHVISLYGLKLLLLRTEKKSLRVFGIQVVWGIVGFTALTLAFCFANWGFGRPFLFFKSQIALAWQLSFNPAEKSRFFWDYQQFGWRFLDDQAPFNINLFFCLLVSLWGLFRLRFRPGTHPVHFAVICTYLLLLAVNIFYHLHGWTVFSTDYELSYIIIVGMLAVAATFDLVFEWKSDTKTEAACVGLFSLGLLALLWWATTHPNGFPFFDRIRQHLALGKGFRISVAITSGTSACVAFLAAFVIGGTVRLYRKGILPAALAGFAAILLTGYVVFFVGRHCDLNLYSHDQGKIIRENTVLAWEASRWLSTHQAKFSQPTAIWTDPEDYVLFEGQTRYGTKSIAQALFFMNTLQFFPKDSAGNAGRQLPTTIEEGKKEDLSPDSPRQIVVCSGLSDSNRLFHQFLALIGWHSVLIEQRTFRMGEGQIEFSLYTLSNSRAMPAGQGISAPHSP